MVIDEATSIRPCRVTPKLSWRARVRFNGPNTPAKEKACSSSVALDVRADAETIPIALPAARIQSAEKPPPSGLDPLKVREPFAGTVGAENRRKCLAIVSPTQIRRRFPRAAADHTVGGGRTPPADGGVDLCRRSIVAVLREVAAAHRDLGRAMRAPITQPAADVDRESAGMSIGPRDFRRDDDVAVGRPRFGRNARRPRSVRHAAVARRARGAFTAAVQPHFDARRSSGYSGG